MILLTNLRDEDDDTLLPALRLLRTRHLVVLASLREAILGAGAVGARRQLRPRRDPCRGGRVPGAARAGIPPHRRRRGDCLDVEPERLPISLVNRYLELKRAGRL